MRSISICVIGSGGGRSLGAGARRAATNRTPATIGGRVVMVVGASHDVLIDADSNGKSIASQHSSHLRHTLSLPVTINFNRPLSRTVNSREILRDLVAGDVSGREFDLLPDADGRCRRAAALRRRRRRRVTAGDRRAPQDGASEPACRSTSGRLSRVSALLPDHVDSVAGRRTAGRCDVDDQRTGVDHWQRHCVTSG